MNAVTFSNAIIPFVLGNIFFLGKNMEMKDRIVRNERY